MAVVKPSKSSDITAKNHHSPVTLPIALDAMGGDFAPDQIIEGARLARDSGINVVLVGQPDALADAGFPIIEASEVIAMDADPGSSVRTMKDSSLVRAAEAVRDGNASAMVSAGNTGATMASALLRMKRMKGVARPAIAATLPIPDSDRRNLLLDAGANSECQPEWLVQFARMGAAYHRSLHAVETPRVGLLSIGEEASKGSPFVKDTHKLLTAPEWQAAAGCTFVGNVEGRDLLSDDVDVVVTDGFTGNVALKTLEGTAKALVDALLVAFGSSEDAQKGAELLLPALAPLYQRLDPDNIGGAALLGVRGLCIISHGSSSAKAISHALRVANELVERDTIASIAESLN